MLGQYRNLLVGSAVLMFVFSGLAVISAGPSSSQFAVAAPAGQTIPVIDPGWEWQVLPEPPAPVVQVAEEPSPTVGTPAPGPAQPSLPAPTAAPAWPASTSGDCSGFVIPDWIIQRESGGRPDAVNPSSGAYGCAQTLPGHYAAVSPWNPNVSGSCYGLDMYSVEGQRACVDILSNGGTNLAPWRF